MPRIPRLYRVRSVHRDGKVEQRHLQSPKPAQEWRERFTEADPTAVVTVTPSHPVTYPHAAGDAATFEIPDTMVSREHWRKVCASLGVDDTGVLGMTVVDGTLVIELESDRAHPGRHAPKLWRVEIED